MSRFPLSRRGSASDSFGPLTFLRAGYGDNAEQLGKIAAELREIDAKEHGDSANARTIISSNRKEGDPCFGI